MGNSFEPERDDNGYIVAPPNYAQLVELCRYGNISSNAADIVEDMVASPQIVLDALIEAGALERRKYWDNGLESGLLGFDETWPDERDVRVVYVIPNK